MADLDGRICCRALLKMPDVVESKATELTEEDWEELFKGNM